MPPQGEEGGGISVYWKEGLVGLVVIIHVE